MHYFLAIDINALVLLARFIVMLEFFSIEVDLPKWLFGYLLVPLSSHHSQLSSS